MAITQELIPLVDEICKLVSMIVEIFLKKHTSAPAFAHMSEKKFQMADLQRQSNQLTAVKLNMEKQTKLAASYAKSLYPVLEEHYECVLRKPFYQIMSLDINPDDRDKNGTPFNVACALDILKAMKKPHIQCRVVNCAQKLRLALNPNEKRTSNVLKFSFKEDIPVKTTDPIYLGIPCSSGSHHNVNRIKSSLKCVHVAADGTIKTKRISRYHYPPTDEKWKVYAFFKLADFTPLIDKYLVVTESVRITHGLVDRQGGTIVSNSDKRVQIVVAPDTVKTATKLSIKVEKAKLQQLQKRKTPINRRLQVKAAGPFCTFTAPNATKTFPGEIRLPVDELRKPYEEKNWSVLVKENEKWESKNATLTADNSLITKVDISPFVTSAVPVMTETELPEDDTEDSVQRLGDAVEESLFVETVTFFYSMKPDPEENLLFLQCCLKRNLECQLQAAERRGFTNHSAPCPDVYLKTIGGRAEIDVSVTGELTLKNGNVKLIFESKLDTAKHSDFLVPSNEDQYAEASSGERLAYVRFLIPPAHAVQKIETNIDGFLCKLPIKLGKKELVQTGKWWDPTIAKATEILKKDYGVINNITTLFRLVLQLDDGTIRNLEHKYRDDLKDRLDGGMNEWQLMRSKNGEEASVLDLTMAFESVLPEYPTFIRITDELKHHPDFRSMFENYAKARSPSPPGEELTEEDVEEIQEPENDKIIVMTAEPMKKVILVPGPKRKTSYSSNTNLSSISISSINNKTESKAEYIRNSPSRSTVIASHNIKLNETVHFLAVPRRKSPNLSPVAVFNHDGNDCRQLLNTSSRPALQSTTRSNPEHNILDEVMNTEDSYEANDPEEPNNVPISSDESNSRSMTGSGFNELLSLSDVKLQSEYSSSGDDKYEYSSSSDDKYEYADDFESSDTESTCN